MESTIKVVDRLDMGDKVERNFGMVLWVLVLKFWEFSGFGLKVHFIKLICTELITL